MSKYSSETMLAVMALMGIDFGSPKLEEDELDMQLRVWDHTLAYEYFLITKKQSGLSARLRKIAVYRFEQKATEEIESKKETKEVNKHENARHSSD